MVEYEAKGRVGEGEGMRRREKGERSMKGPFTDLIVWQKAMELVKAVYALSKVFPPDERYALTDQIRRAAVSIPSKKLRDPPKMHTVCALGDFGATVGVDERGGVEGYFRPYGDSF